MEYKWEDLYEFDYYCLEDPEIDSDDGENNLEDEDTDPDDEIFSRE